jgi:imidazolonepropionase-like amidohydrolase
MSIKLFLFIPVLLLTAMGAWAGSTAGKTLLLKNGNIIPISGENVMGGDILIKAGKIVKVGKNLPVEAGAEVIDLAGQWVMPGIIDSHAHIALEGGVNEMGNLMTPEVDVRDIINPDDLNIYYALSGGVTAIHTMHGSANPIGGRGAVLKMRWGKTGEEMLWKGAPLTLKWALGENPKQSNFNMPGPQRYPKTRMGVEASIRDLFEKAKVYMKVWREYDTIVKAKKGSGPLPLPPKRDIQLEVVADTLGGKYWVRCHGYQSEEMESILHLCQEYGVKLACFEHAWEAYRIAPELARAKVAVSTFADFWGYKWEAFNTMPYNAAYLAKRGVLTALNSDDAERMRHLFLEAAKTVRFGGLSELEALKTITINPAIILGVDRQAGTLEVGKDADLAVFSRHPLDPYTVCEKTLVDGIVYFDRTKYLEDRAKVKEEKKPEPGPGTPEKKMDGREV